MHLTRIDYFICIKSINKFINISAAELLLLLYIFHSLTVGYETMAQLQSEKAVNAVKQQKKLKETVGTVEETRDTTVQTKTKKATAQRSVAVVTVKIRQILEAIGSISDFRLSKRTIMIASYSCVILCCIVAFTAGVLVGLNHVIPTTSSWHSELHFKVIFNICENILCWSN